MGIEKCGGWDQIKKEGGGKPESKLGDKKTTAVALQTRRRPKSSLPGEKLLMPKKRKGSVKGPKG